MKSISRAMLPLKAVEETPSLPGGNQQFWCPLACNASLQSPPLSSCSTIFFLPVCLFSHEVFLSYEDVSQKDEGPTLLKCDLTSTPAMTLFPNRIAF